MVTPDRLIPANRASDWAVPMSAPRSSSRSSWRPGASTPSAGTVATEGRRRRRSPRNRITPLRMRKAAAAAGLAKTARRGCSNTNPMTPTGIVPATSSQASRSSGVDPACRARREEAFDDPHPGRPVVDQQRERGGDVQRHQEGEVEGLARGLGLGQVVPAEQFGQEHRVAEARDRHELGDTLEEADHDRLEVADHRSDFPAAPASPVRGRVATRAKARAERPACRSMPRTRRARRRSFVAAGGRSGRQFAVQAPRLATGQVRHRRNRGHDRDDAT